VQKNKFFILGLPRSGTTAVANTLNSYDNVHMHSTKKVEGIIDNESHLFEPFALANTKVMLDWKPKLINNIEPNFNQDYNGFKVIFGDQVSIHRLVNEFNYRPLVVIRKNIWKMIFSKIAAMWAVAEEDDSDNKVKTYTKSSRLANANFSYFPLFVPRFEFFLNQFIKIIYELENEIMGTCNPISIIYFEDFVKPNATNDKLIEYFGQDIIFNLNYDDSFDIIDEYLSEAKWSNNQYKYLSSRIDATIEKFNIKIDPTVPDWLKEVLINHPFVDK
jgi:hypothetical protein